MNFYQNKTVWVIGGTSGIGLATVEMLAKVQGCEVIASGRNIANIAKVQNVEAKTLDVTNSNNFSQVCDEIVQKHQKIDVILFCVGTYDPMSLENFNAENALKILDTNLGSMAHLLANIHKFYGKTTKLGIVSSVAGYFGMPNSLFYGASKAGLSHLVESLHIELKKHNIDVKLINPGFVKTPLTAKNTFKMPFIISPEKAAAIILQKLPKSTFEIAFPWKFVLILKILKAFPQKIRAKILNN
jgi:short-subunit dehydrogenase